MLTSAAGGVTPPPLLTPRAGGRASGRDSPDVRKAGSLACVIGARKRVAGRVNSAAAHAQQVACAPPPTRELRCLFCASQPTTTSRPQVGRRLQSHLHVRVCLSQAATTHCDRSLATRSVCNSSAHLHLSPVTSARSLRFRGVASARKRTEWTNVCGGGDGDGTASESGPRGSSKVRARSGGGHRIRRRRRRWFWKAQSSSSSSATLHKCSLVLHSHS